MDKDNEYSRLALEKAYSAYERGDLPVGAVISIDDDIILTNSNKHETNYNRTEHAENGLFYLNGKLIREKVEGGSVVTLYSSLEPCLMCLSTAVVNRVSRIVYSCPDPYGGACNLNPVLVKNFYVQNWPVISEDLVFRDESYNLLTAFMRENREKWSQALREFEKDREKI